MNLEEYSTESKASSQLGRLKPRTSSPSLAYRAHGAGESRLLSLAIHNTRDAILITDSWGKIRIQNRSAENLLDSAIGRDGSQVLANFFKKHEASSASQDSTVRFPCPLARALEGSSILKERWPRRDCDPERSFLITALPLFEENNRMEGVMVKFERISDDVTGDLRRARQMLRESQVELSQSNSDLEQFARVASHDLKEPLRMVNIYLQMLDSRYRGCLDRRGHDYISFALEGAARLHGLLDDLVGYSQLQNPIAPRETVDLNAAVCHALRQVGRNEQFCEVKFECALLPSVKANFTQMVQLITNLIENGLKFRGASNPEITITCDDLGPEWKIGVRDNGIGIDPQFNEKVFVIFQKLHGRSTYSGTGIGLALCKRIVEKHHGTIWFESTPEAGSTFYFTLPK